jgi:hypothetical protein
VDGAKVIETSGKLVWVGRPAIPRRSKKDCVKLPSNLFELKKEIEASE